jgi:hypothetical protein
MIHYYGFGKGNSDFTLVFISNQPSITHHLWLNQNFPFAGNDVIVLSPLGGAASNFFTSELEWVI